MEVAARTLVSCTWTMMNQCWHGFLHGTLLHRASACPSEQSIVEVIDPVLLNMLFFCCATTVGRCAETSPRFADAACQDCVWRELCHRRWITKQHSLYLRRWLSDFDACPSLGKLSLYHASDEVMMGSECASPPTRRRDQECLATWRGRYIFAERDARRTNITREELCCPPPCTHQIANACLTGKRVATCGGTRRWRVSFNMGHPFDFVAFFFVDGTYRDTGRFSTVTTSWHFLHLGPNEVQIHILMPGPQLPPLRVERTEDWGWRLVSTGMFPNLTIFTSEP